VRWAARCAGWSAEIELCALGPAVPWEPQGSLPPPPSPPPLHRPDLLRHATGVCVRPAAPTGGWDGCVASPALCVPWVDGGPFASRRVLASSLLVSSQIVNGWWCSSAFPPALCAAARSVPNAPILRQVAAQSPPPNPSRPTLHCAAAATDWPVRRGHRGDSAQHAALRIHVGQACAGARPRVSFAHINRWQLEEFLFVRVYGTGSTADLCL